MNLLYRTAAQRNYVAAPVRYFCHVYDDDVYLDDEGSELPGPDAAHQAAVELARELAAWAVKGGELNLAHRIHVVDSRAHRSAW